MQSSTADLHDAGRVPLSWALTVASADRADILRVCVRQAVAQTRAPAEIIVVDASPDIDANRAALAGIVPEGIRLLVVPAQQRNISVQRNQAMQLATADIIFLIDDDSLMYPDCAEALLSCYEADPDALIAALGAVGVATSPVPLGDGFVAKDTPGQRSQSALLRMRQSALGRFIYRHVLRLTIESQFFDYEPRTAPATAQHGADGDLVPTPYIYGYSLTVRRGIALAEPFAGGELPVSNNQDMDATLRYRRHGVLYYHRGARLFHAVSGANRLKAQRLLAVRALNMAYFARKGADRPESLRWRLATFLVQNGLAAGLRDLLSRRFGLPNARAILRGLRPDWIILGLPEDQVAAFLSDRQRQELSR